MKILKNPIQIRNAKILIVYDDMIAHMLSNKTLNLIVTELFIRDRKINISLIFITQSYFAVLDTNSTHTFLHIHILL